MGYERDIINDMQPRWIVSCGFSGGFLLGILKPEAMGPWSKHLISRGITSKHGDITSCN